MKLCTITRLEFCAVLMLGKLFHLVFACLPQIPQAQVFAIFDSEDTLCWLAKDSSHWKTFVANRNEGSTQPGRNVTNELKIEKYRIVENGIEKPFCVFVVEANINGCIYVVEKRYSQFHALHSELRKFYPTPYFPPKKVKSLQQRVLEKRKQTLEKYLQTMLKFNQSRSQVLLFLGIIKYDTECEQEKASEREFGHQLLFHFKKEFIPYSSRKSNLPDIVVDGVLLGFYKTA